MAMKRWSPSLRNFVLYCFVYQGLWSITFGYVQERATSNDGDSEPSVPAHLTARSLAGYCPDYWYTFEDMCYKSFGELQIYRKSWNDASSHCRSLGSNLASVHTSEEQDFLTVLVLDIGSVAWIGLRRSRCRYVTNCANSYYWEDGSSVDYLNWGKRHDSLREDRCAQIQPYHWAFGKWTDASCGDKFAYICKRPKDPSLTKPGIDPSICVEPEGFLKIRSSCYKVFYGAQNNVTWRAAESLCNKYYAGNLASVKSLSVTMHLHKYLQGQQDLFWIGIQSVDGRKYTWFGKEPLLYSNWGIEQPKEIPDQLSCAVVDSEGKWMVKDCNERHPFICEVLEDIRRPTIAPYHLNLTCPDNSPKWHDFGGKYCYIIEINEKVPADEAARRCSKEGGFLASFHSIDEVNVVMHYIKDNNEAPLIGLQRRNGTFAWSDGSVVDFLNWDDGEPNFSHEECTEMIPNGKWNDNICSISRGYICSALKVRKKDEQVTVTDNLVDGKTQLPAGIIALIIFTVLVLAVAVSAACVTYFCPSVTANFSDRKLFVRL